MTYPLFVNLYKIYLNGDSATRHSLGAESYLVFHLPVNVSAMSVKAFALPSLAVGILVRLVVIGLVDILHSGSLLHCGDVRGRIRLGPRIQPCRHVPNGHVVWIRVTRVC